MQITAAMIKELRDKTGAGIMDCKVVLKEVEGDVEAAIDALRKKGVAAAAKKAGRATAQGLVHAYIHGGGTLGVLVEINCETDFVSRTDDYKAFCNDVAMHVAAAEPRYLTKDEVTEADLDRERTIFLDQAKAEGKPEHIAAKIVEGRMKKFYSQVCLMEQPYVKDTDKTIAEFLKEAIAKFGENMQIARFSRFKLGESVEG
jgi:elongation factor Ts